MEKEISQLHQILKKLLGLHTQLLETVRMEKEALVLADLKGIQEASYAKEALVEGIRSQESKRQLLTGELAMVLKKPVRELTLSKIIIEVQAKDLKAADLLRSAQTALGVLITRVTEQNNYNRTLLEKSAVHIEKMKNNVLGEAAPHASTYNNQGQRSSGAGSSRIISKEA